MFADTLHHFGNQLAIILPNGRSITYAQLAQKADEFAARLGPGKKLLLIEASNQLEPLIAYIGALRGRHPVLLTAASSKDVLAAIYQAYQPDARYSNDQGNWKLTPSSPRRGEYNEDLAVLLSTSGSTGNPKVIRLSYRNIDSNAKSIAQYLNIDHRQRPITPLSFHYSFGLSVINSHFAQGATLLFTEHSVVDREFWDFFKEMQATSLSGVPYTYEMLDRMRFEEMNLPSLQYLTQAGGRLSESMVKKYARLCQSRGWRFFVMYGQTEASPRMAYLPPDNVLSNPDCIGIPIPGGDFHLIDKEGQTIQTADTAGELIYRGPNVMMGYAFNQADLAKPANCKELKTGDIACRNTEGLYYLVGRMSRFVKLYGHRINLDDVEEYLTSLSFKVICGGDDTRLVIFTLSKDSQEAITEAVAHRFKLHHKIIKVKEVKDYPLLISGKIDYQALKESLNEEGTPASLLEDIPFDAFPIKNAYALTFNTPVIRNEDTFYSLGGDSLSYVGLSSDIEAHLGYLPSTWDKMSVQELEQLRPRKKSLATIETNIVLRALAISAVVFNHSNTIPFSLSGGAMFLFIIAGFNVARFQGATLQNGIIFQPILQLIKNLYIPFIIFAIIYQILKGNLNIPEILLFNNFISPQRGWFIPVLIQIIALFALLFTVRGIRSASVRSPWGFGLACFLVTALIRLYSPQLMDFSYVHHRVPHLWIWAFSLGWFIYFSRTLPQKMVTTALILALAYPICYISPETIWMVVGGLALLWCQSCQVPLQLKTVIITVAASAYYIYLYHGSIFHFTRKILGQDLPLLNFSLGISGGCVIFMGIKALQNRRIGKRWFSTKR